VSRLLTVALPWPDKALSPNSRDRWKKIEATKAARAEGAALAKNCGAAPGCLKTGPLLEFITAFPPDGRWYDNTNIAASLKAAEDGIFDACEANDHRVTITHVERKRPTEGGLIYFEIFEVDA
jgi:crossover junction endodeoxyribonuclease RusA